MKNKTFVPFFNDQLESCNLMGSCKQTARVHYLTLTLRLQLSLPELGHIY
jgi:hypothetical protein